MLKSVTYNALEPGPRLLILGAVHGNEKCGTEAITQVMQRLDHGALTLARGQLTFVPVCNPRAYAADLRQTDYNLNRAMMRRASTEIYEFKIQNALCPLLEHCDVLLDIHSYTAPIAKEGIVEIGTPTVVDDSAKPAAPPKKK